MTKNIRVMIIIIAIATTLIIATGVTLGLVTSDNRSAGTISTAKLNLTAEATDFKVFSAVRTFDSQTEGVIYDEHHMPYVYEESGIKSGNTLYFKNGGSVSYDSENGVDITGFMPGDKVEFDLKISSDSNIAFNYRTELRVDKTLGDALVNQLNFKAGDIELRHFDLNSIKDNPSNQVDGKDNLVRAAATDWKALSTNRQEIETVHISVEFPLTATRGQGASTKLYYLAVGSQNDDELPEIAEVEAGGQKERFKYLQDAVDFAYASGISDVKVLGSNVMEEGSVVVKHGVNFVGVADANGKLPTLNGARFSFEDAAATFTNVNFAGDSYIDVSRCIMLGLKNCNVDIVGSKYFDTSARAFLSDEAFIVSGESLISPKLDIQNSTFSSVKGAAVNMRSKLANDSVFAGNVFGSKQKPLTAGSVLMLCGAETNAKVTFANNVFYGNKGIYFNSAATNAFTALSSGNKAFVSGAFADGKANVAFCDNGSQINGKAVTNADIASGGMLFAGTNVAYTELGYIVAGTFSLNNASADTFFIGYVDKAQLAENAITLLNAQGVPYAHLNSNNGGGYKIDEIN